MSHYSRHCRARDYLAAQFNERTSLADAAAQAGLSPFYFHRRLRSFKETPHRVRHAAARIEQAKKLLLAGNHSVTDICLDAGYESLGSFSTRFHSLTGLSPAAFRARRLWGLQAITGPCTTCLPASNICSPGSTDRKIREASPRLATEAMIQTTLSHQLYVLEHDAARDFYVNKLASRSAWTRAWTMASAGLPLARRASRTSS